MSLLKASGISKSYGGFQVLNQVSIEVQRAALTGIAGTNGAGKSTLFAVMSGQIVPDSGQVVFNGHEITAMAPRHRAQQGLGRTFQQPREFKQLSVRENFLAAAPRKFGETLTSICFSWPQVKAEEATLLAIADRWIDFLNLGAVAGKPAGSLSGGQKKLLELGRVLMLNPSCILLDEPFAGVNPVLIDEISEKIIELNQQKGMAFVIIEHHLEALKSLVQHMYVMDQGKILASGAPLQVLDDPRVHEAYMGGVI